MRHIEAAHDGVWPRAFQTIGGEARSAAEVGDGPWQSSEGSANDGLVVAADRVDSPGFALVVHEQTGLRHVGSRCQGPIRREVVAHVFIRWIIPRSNLSLALGEHFR